MAKSKKRANKRAREAAEALQEAQAEQAAQTSLLQEEDELFVLDSQGTSGGIAAKAVQEAKRQKRTFQDERVAKLQAKYTPDQLTKMANEGKKRMPKKATLLNRGIKVKKEKAFDLWDAEEDQDPTNKKKTPKVELSVQAGQSYRPDSAQHQVVLKQAVRVEVARQKAELDRDGSQVATGMRPETRALLFEDSSSDSSSDEEEGDAPVGTVDIQRHRATEKKTRAQRNKERRHRVSLAIQKAAKKGKKMMKQVNEIPKFEKEMRRAQAKKAVTNTTTDAPLSLEQRISQKQPLHAPTLPVTLKVSATLRTLQPVGNAPMTVLHQAMESVVQTVGTRRKKHRRAKAVKGAKNNIGFAAIKG